MAAPDAFAAVHDALAAVPGVTAGTGFGTMPGLRVGGRIFAMLFEERLVVKLPAPRAAELVAAGDAQPFRIGTRELREWISLEPGHEPAWPALAREALAFVGSA